VGQPRDSRSVCDRICSIGIDVNVFGALGGPLRCPAFGSLSAVVRIREVESNSRQPGLRICHPSHAIPAQAQARQGLLGQLTGKIRITAIDRQQPPKPGLLRRAEGHEVLRRLLADGWLHPEYNAQLLETDFLARRSSMMACAIYPCRCSGADWSETHGYVRGKQSQPEGVDAMLTLTTSASEAIQTLIDSVGGPEGAGLRIWAEPVGEQQSSLEIALTPGPQEADEVVETSEVPVYLEPQAAIFLHDKVLDASVEGDTIQFSISDQPGGGPSSNQQPPPDMPAT
jgi:iron-sulfur cluster assembly protein